MKKENQKKLLTDHDLLVELRTDVQWIKNQLGNHLRHHWIITAGITVALVGVLIRYLVFALQGT